MMNLIRHEMTLNKRGFGISFILVVGFMAMMASLANVYLENDQIVEMLDSFPPGLMEAFGISADSFASFTGFISSESFTFFILLLGASTGIWSSASISKERDHQTGEFLFTMPYSRETIFLSKALAHFIFVTIIYAASFGVIALFGTMMSDLTEYSSLFWLWTSGYFICLAFAGIGYLLTSFLASERSAISLGVGIVLVSFVLNMFSGMDESVSWLAKLSLFSAFDVREIVDQSRLTLVGVLVTLGLYALGLGFGTLTFKHKDIA